MFTHRQLEILAAFERTGSFRQCAASCGISPVSVGDQMRALELQLGVDLFMRMPGGATRLTPAGARAVKGVADLLAHMDEFKAHVLGEAEGPKLVRVAMHGFMMRNIAAATAELEAERGLRIELVSDDGPAEALHRRVMAGELDLAYFYSAAGLNQPGGVVALEPLAIYVGESHPLAAREAVTLGELDGHKAISLARDRDLRRAVDGILQAAGVRTLAHAVETSEFGLILSSLHQNLGYCCMFDAIRHESKQVTGLAALRLAAPLPPLEVRRLSRRMSSHREHVRSVAARLERILEGANAVSR